MTACDIIPDDALLGLRSASAEAQHRAFKSLYEHAGDDTPMLLLELYRRAKDWQTRAACAYFAIFFGRWSPDALELGLAAVFNKSTVVRYRACGLLAFSLKYAALDALRKVQTSATDGETRRHATNAIEAIEKRNHHIFQDIDRSGRVTWTVAGIEPSRIRETSSG